MALAYIDSRDVQDRLDAVCGAGGWQCRYPHAGQKTVCEIGVKIDGEWIWKADGAGDSDVEAEKGALSDAFKRAAVKWGIGRYLYDLDSPWVKITQKGRSYVIAEGEFAKLQRLLPSVPNTTPDGLPVAKNAPGVSKARKWVSEYLDEMRKIETAEAYCELIYGAKSYWVKICADYPGLWSGPDGSGLRGEAMKISMIVGARDDFDTFVREVELMARETQAQAAE
jgi:hypothetical protein